MFVRLVPNAEPTLEDPTNCREFHVEAPAAADVAAHLGDAGTAAAAPDGHAWIGIDWVRRKAAGRVGERWDADFEAMLAFAASKGWLNADATAIQAHVVTPGGSG